MSYPFPIAKRMLQIMGQSAKELPLHEIVMHAKALDKAIGLRDRISSWFNYFVLFITEFPPVIGVHTGSRVTDVACYSKYKEGSP